MGLAVRKHRPHVARRLHHPQCFLGNIKEAYDKNPALPNLMLDPWFTNKLRECSAGWRRVVALGALSGVPTPCFSSALSFYDGYRSI